MATDPTLEFLAQLNDPARFVKVEHVPVFVCHKRKLPDGKTVAVGPERLADILERSRGLESERGVVARVTLGHTKPGVDQPEQPPIVGFARFEGIGEFGPARTRAILATVYYKAEDWERAKGYPYRSVEYYPETDTITGVALLKTDPMLDLGMVSYGRDGAVYLHFGEEKMADESNPVEPPKADESEKKEGGIKGPPDVEPGFHESFMRCMKHHFPTVYSRMEEDAAKERDEGREEERRDEGGEPARAGRGSDPVAYARLHAELEKERAERRAFQLRYERAECERIADQLEKAGYSFGREKFIHRILGLDQAGRKAEIDDVVKYARRNGNELTGDAGFVPLAYGVEGGQSPEFTEAHLRVAEKYMRDHPEIPAGRVWDEARAFAMKGGK